MPAPTSAAATQHSLSAAAPAIQETDPITTLFPAMQDGILRIVSSYLSSFSNKSSESRELARYLQRELNTTTHENRNAKIITMLRQIFSAYADRIAGSANPETAISESRLLNQLYTVCEVGLLVISRNTELLALFLEGGGDSMLEQTFFAGKQATAETAAVPPQTIGDSLYIRATYAGHTHNMETLTEACPSIHPQNLNRSYHLPAIPTIAQALEKARQNLPAQTPADASRGEAASAPTLFAQDALDKVDVLTRMSAKHPQGTLTFALQQEMIFLVSNFDDEMREFDVKFPELFNKAALRKVTGKQKLSQQRANAAAEEQNPAQDSTKDFVNQLKTIQILHDMLQEKYTLEKKGHQTSSLEREMKDLAGDLKAMEEMLKLEAKSDLSAEERTAILKNTALLVRRDWSSLFDPATHERARQDHFLRHLRRRIPHRTTGLTELDSFILDTTNWAETLHFGPVLDEIIEQFGSLTPYVSDEQYEADQTCRPSRIPNHFLSMIQNTDLSGFEAALLKLHNPYNLAGLFSYTLQSGETLLDSAPPEFIAIMLKRVLGLTYVTNDQEFFVPLEDIQDILSSLLTRLFDPAVPHETITAALSNTCVQQIKAREDKGQLNLTAQIIDGATKHAGETGNYVLLDEIIGHVANNPGENRIKVIKSTMKKTVELTKNPHIFAILLDKLARHSTDDESLMVSLLTILVEKVKIANPNEAARSLTKAIKVINARGQSSISLVGWAIEHRLFDLSTQLMTHGVSATESSKSDEAAPWMMVLEQAATAEKEPLEAAQFAQGMLTWLLEQREAQAKKAKADKKTPPPRFSDEDIQAALKAVSAIEAKIPSEKELIVKLRCLVLENNLNNAIDQGYLEEATSMLKANIDPYEVKLPHAPYVYLALKIQSLLENGRTVEAGELIEFAQTFYAAAHENEPAPETLDAGERQRRNDLKADALDLFEKMSNKTYTHVNFTAVLTILSPSKFPSKEAGPAAPNAQDHHNEGEEEVKEGEKSLYCAGGGGGGGGGGYAAHIPQTWFDVIAQYDKSSNFNEIPQTVLDCSVFEKEDGQSKTPFALMTGIVQQELESGEMVNPDFVHAFYQAAISFVAKTGVNTDEAILAEYANLEAVLSLETDNASILSLWGMFPAGYTFQAPSTTSPSRGEAAAEESSTTQTQEGPTRTPTFEPPKAAPPSPPNTNGAGFFTLPAENNSSDGYEEEKETSTRPRNSTE